MALLLPVTYTGQYTSSIHLLKGRVRHKLNQGDGAPLNPFCLSQTFLSQTSGNEAHAPLFSCSVIVFLLSASSLWKTRYPVLAWTWQRAPLPPPTSSSLLWITQWSNHKSRSMLSVAGWPSTPHVQGLCCYSMRTPQPVSWRPVSGKLCSSSGTFSLLPSFSLSLHSEFFFFILVCLSSCACLKTRAKFNDKSFWIVMIERENECQKLENKSYMTKEPPQSVWPHP